MASLGETLASYKKNGYAIIRDFLPAETCAALRAIVDPALDVTGGENVGGMDRWGEGEFDGLGLALLHEYFVQRLELLDFVELLMGPFVQLDTLQILSREPPAPSMEYIAQGGNPSKQATQTSWHRDAFTLSQTWSAPGETTPFRTQRNADGVKAYTAPSACNCLVYLQEMNDDIGTFRVVPGSHLDFTPTPTQPGPPPGEVSPSIAMGDLLVLHCDVLHGGAQGMDPDRDRR